MMTPDLARELWSYDPITGVIRWKVRPARRVQIGDIATSIQIRKSGSNRLQVKYKGKIYKAHRIAWGIHYGHVPIGEIYHENGDATDNRISNLRDVPHVVNCRNRVIPRTNTSGRIGVFQHPKTGNWTAYIWRDNKQVQLGTFSTFDEASAARGIAEIACGFHTNHGRITPPQASPAEREP